MLPTNLSGNDTAAAVSAITFMVLFFWGGGGWLKENIKYTSAECGYNHKCTHDKSFVWIDGSGRIDAVPSTTVSGKIQTLSTTAPLFFQRINTANRYEYVLQIVIKA